MPWSSASGRRHRSQRRRRSRAKTSCVSHSPTELRRDRGGTSVLAAHHPRRQRNVDAFGAVEDATPPCEQHRMARDRFARIVPRATRPDRGNWVGTCLETRASRPESVGRESSSRTRLSTDPHTSPSVTAEDAVWSRCAVDPLERSALIRTDAWWVVVPWKGSHIVITAPHAIAKAPRVSAPNE